LTVDDDGRARDEARPGLGIGLTNVRDRLRMRYGSGARLAAGPRAQGGYRAQIELPRA
jgi:two-component system LytT family sensor kinase